MLVQLVSLLLCWLQVEVCVCTVHAILRGERRCAVALLWLTPTIASALLLVPDNFLLDAHILLSWHKLFTYICANYLGSTVHLHQVHYDNDL